MKNIRVDICGKIKTDIMFKIMDEIVMTKIESHTGYEIDTIDDDVEEVLMLIIEGIDNNLANI